MKKDELTPYQREYKTWLNKGKLMLGLSVLFLILMFAKPEHMGLFGLLSYGCYALIGRVQGEGPER